MTYTHSFSCSATESIAVLDAGLIEPGSISGTAFLESGTPDGLNAGEAPIDGVEVQLWDATTNMLVTVDVYGNPFGTVTTSPSGDFTFANLPPGDYFVVFVTPAGLTITTQLDGNVTGDTDDSDIDGTGQTPIFTLTSGQSLIGVDGGYFACEKPTLSTSVTHEDCTGDNNGAIDLILTGGAGTFDYLWSNGETTQDIAGLMAGTYMVTVTVNDNTLCTVEHTATVQLINTAGPTITCPDNVRTCEVDGYAEFEDPIVSDDCDAATYTLSHISGTLYPIGTTIVTATAEDNDGNTASCTFSVSYNPMRTGVEKSDNNGVNVSCHGESDAWATAQYSGGFPPFQYLWSDGQTTQTATGLTAGHYTVTVTDSAGCQAVSMVEITQAQPLTCSALGTAELCLDAGDGTATINASGGVGDYMYSWVKVVFGPTLPISNTSASIGGLTSGVYEGTVTDANGCQCRATYTVEGGETTILAAEGSISQGEGGVDPFDYNRYEIIVCGGQSNAYTLDWEKEGYVRYSVEPIMVDTAENCIHIIVEYIDESSWSVIITDPYGCEANVLQFDNMDVTEGSEEILDIVSHEIGGAAFEIGCYEGGPTGGSITLEVMGGVQPYTYQWSSNTNWTNPPPGPNQNELTELPSGWYYVTITDAATPPQTTESWYWVSCCKPGDDRGPCSTVGKAEGAENEVTEASGFATLRVQPNPFDGLTNLVFNVASTGHASLTIYSIDGKVVDQLFNQEAEAGILYEVTFEPGDLPADVYFVKLVTESGQTQYQRMIYAR